MGQKGEGIPHLPLLFLTLRLPLKGCPLEQDKGTLRVNPEHATPFRLGAERLTFGSDFDTV